MANDPNDPNKQTPSANAEKPKAQPAPGEQEQKRAKASSAAHQVQQTISENQGTMSQLNKKHSKEIAAQGATRGNRAPTTTAEGGDQRSHNDAAANRKLSSKHDAEANEAKAKLKPLPPILTL